MPPKRKHGKDLPPNLYPATDTRDGVTRYRYRDPRSGRFHGMGADKAQAVADAKALNAIIAQGMAQARVAGITNSVNVIPELTPKLSAVILKHLELCDIRLTRGRLSQNTLKSKRSHGEAIRRAFGPKPIGEVTVKDFAALIESYVEQGKDRAAQAVRSEAIEIWKTAIAEGLVKENVPAMTRSVDVAVKRERLTLEAYMKIREAANGLEGWIGLSMDLAMVTAQRREDIACMEFKPRDDATGWVQDGSLWVIQNKTGNRVCIPLSLRNDALGLSVGEVIAKCRNRVVSPYLLHHTRERHFVKPGDPIWIDTLSKGFARARNLTGLTWPEGKLPPTFHEMRSLAIRLYAEQGVDVQALAGHKDAATTALYRDVRGAEWIRVSA